MCYASKLPKNVDQIKYSFVVQQVKISLNSATRIREKSVPHCNKGVLQQRKKFIVQ